MVVIYFIVNLVLSVVAFAGTGNAMVAGIEQHSTYAMFSAVSIGIVVILSIISFIAVRIKSDLPSIIKFLISLAISLVLAIVVAVVASLIIIAIESTY